MAKAKRPGYVYFGISVPVKLANRLEARLRQARKLQPYMRVTKSAFVVHALGEWLELLQNPEAVPTTSMPPRRRTRPPAIRTEGRLTPREIRKIRRDPRPAVDVAREFGVHKSTVGRVRNGTTHRAVT